MYRHRVQSLGLLSAIFMYHCGLTQTTRESAEEATISISNGKPNKNKFEEAPSCSNSLELWDLIEDYDCSWIQKKVQMAQEKLHSDGKTTARNAVIGTTVGALANAVGLPYAWTVIRDTLSAATMSTNSSADTGGLEQKLDQIIAKNASRQGFEKQTQKIALAYCLAAPFGDMLGGGGLFTAHCLEVAGAVGVYGLASDAQNYVSKLSKLSDLTDCLCAACEISEQGRQAIHERLKFVQVQPKITDQDVPEDDPDDQMTHVQVQPKITDQDVPEDDPDDQMTQSSTGQ